MGTSENSAQSTSQTDFVPTPYKDQSWEIIGEAAESQEFVPMEVEAVASTSHTVDPMFADYGGFAGQGEGKRWHLPEHLSIEVARQEKEEEAPGQRLTDEEIAAIKEAAKAEGHAAGKAEAEAGFTEQIKLMQDRLVALFQDMGQQLKGHLGEIETSALELSLAISEKVVGYAVEINPEYIQKVISDALGHAGGAVIRKVRVSPQDYEFIQVVGVAKQLKEFDGSWDFESDESIKTGCIVETSAGQVDFQLDSAWERIRDNVLKSKV
ncbi:MAG: flagellar assembly protein FliH [Oligoflexia bacterium]|nr:flagellar assembly protein FliH [Oligoflexia bacterium]